MNAVDQFCFNEQRSNALEATKEYEPIITTDLSGVRKFDKGRIISAINSRKSKRKRKINYNDDAFNPKDVSNWKF